MKRYKKFLFANALFMVSSVTLAAGVMLPNAALDPIYKNGVDAVPYVELFAMGGVASLAAGNSTVRITDSETDELVPDNNELGAWTAAVGAGYVIPRFGAKEYSKSVQWFTAIEPEVNLYYLNGDINGDVYRFQSPAFDQLDYTMDLSSTRLMLDLGVTVASWRNLSAYVLGGFGPSWNRLGFNSHTKDTVDCDLYDVGLNPNDSLNFTYEAGAGLKYRMSEHTSIFVEYLYTNFQHMEVGDSNDVSDLNPSTFNLNSQAGFLGLRYMF